MKKAINEKIFCYLTPEADKAVAELMAIGLDVDLALAVLEKLWPEAAIFELGDEQHGETS